MRACLRSARPVADLVPVETGRRENVVSHLVHVGVQVVVDRRDFSATNASFEGGALLDNQGVRRHVVHPPVEHSIERSAPIVEGLPRCAVDEVDTHVEAGRTRGSNDISDTFGVVCAIESGEDMRDHRLHPQADTREASLGQILEVGQINGIGIGLCGDLGVVRYPEARRKIFTYGYEVVRRKERGGSPAKEDGVEGPHPIGVTQYSVREFDFPRHHLNVGVATRSTQFITRICVEVAVAATHATVGNVHIGRKRSRDVRRDSRGKASVGSGSLTLGERTGH